MLYLEQATRRMTTMETMTFRKPLCQSCQRQYVALLKSVEGSDQLPSRSLELFAIRHVPTAECAGSFSITVPGQGDGSVVFFNPRTSPGAPSSSTEELPLKASPMSNSSTPPSLPEIGS